MSYLVLARKYRPRTFHEVKGQEHTVRALVNALDNDRLHHAYLFSGTRGVGKTTLGRILANCLNCETGVTSTPCGECASCIAFRDGNFIDLIEVDAASRTGVDDMRQLLENANLKPAMGRYRVYLIDEVHMLSASSFNALLKTLEEPPDHVKFVLATTDPKKIPVTVMSRCLQFHLRNIPSETVEVQLSEVLNNEGIAAEQEALKVISRASDGSMRDALSIADQAISHGGGSISAVNVSQMLGTARTDEVARILELIIAGDRREVLDFVQGLATRAVNYGDLIASLQRSVHAMSLFHVTGEIDDENLVPFAQRLSPEWLQVAYQILLIGMRDLRYAPDHRTGFDMTILRLLDFEPVAAYPISEPSSGKSGPTEASPSGEQGRESTDTTSLESAETEQVSSQEFQMDSESAVRANETQTDALETKEVSHSESSSRSPTSQPWYETVDELDIPIEIRQRLISTELVGQSEDQIVLRTSPTYREYWSSENIEEVNTALQKAFGNSYSTTFEYAKPQGETPKQRLDRLRSESEKAALDRRDQQIRDLDERKRLANEELENDSFVQSLKEQFGARILDIRLH